MIRVSAKTVEALARRTASVGVILCGAMLAGCGTGHGEVAESPDAGTYDPGPAPVDDSESPYAFPARPETVDRICARGNQDPVVAALCVSPRPTIRSLVDLERALGLDPDTATLALNANSSSLVARRTTPLNPRIVLFRADGQGRLALGFVRGEQFVELIGIDASGTFNLYLLRFEQGCNANAGRCGLADLLGPRIESEWTSWGLYQDIDLVNTPVDCLVCHQPGGPSTRRVLRMQELRAPWLHWFPASPQGESESERRLAAAFAQAHGAEERYGGVQVARIVEPSLPDGSDPRGGANSFESFVSDMGDPIDHPLSSEDLEAPQKFDSFRVLEERDRGSRATWQSYQADVWAGRRIPVPFFDVDPSDPTLETQAAAAYRAVVTGSAPPESMPDVRDIFSAEARVALSFEPDPSEDGATLVRHFCGRCHNDRLDPTLSRAHFNALDRDANAPEVRSLAATRLQLDPDSPWVMPPARFATLSPAAREALARHLTGP